MSDAEWAMFTAECVRDIKKPFPDIGDFHGANAVAIYSHDTVYKAYSTNYKLYKDSYRDASKRMGLAFLYGSSYRVVTTPDGRPMPEAEQRRLFTNFFSSLKGFSKHLSDTEPKARKDLYTTNIFGYRVWLRDFNHKDFKIASLVRRRFLNAPIQSAGSQALLVAMYRITKLSEITHSNRFANDNIHNAYYTRVVTVSEATSIDPAFMDAINGLKNGNIALCIEKDGELTQQWDRPLAIDTDFIDKWGLKLYF